MCEPLICDMAFCSDLTSHHVWHVGQILLPFVFLSGINVVVPSRKIETMEEKARISPATRSHVKFGSMRGLARVEKLTVHSRCGETASLSA